MVSVNHDSINDVRGDVNGFYEGDSVPRPLETLTRSPTRSLATRGRVPGFVGGDVDGGAGDEPLGPSTPYMWATTSRRRTGREVAGTSWARASK
jgi:hypothetical protein